MAWHSFKWRVMGTHVPLSSSPSAGTAISAGVEMNQAEFFEANQVNGELTDAQAMQMLALPEGDSDPVPAPQEQTQSSETPAAADDPVKQQTETPKVEEETPVLLAKDGKHTIPYEELEKARKGEQLYKQQAEEYQRKLEEMQSQAAKPQQQAQEQPKAPAATTGWISKEEITRAFGDFSEENLANGIASLVDKRAESLVAAVEAKAEAKAIEKVRAEFEAREVAAKQREHFDAIRSAHPDAESIAQSVELEAWIKQQPSYAQAGILQALQQGTAAQVIEALDAFKSSTTKSVAPAPAPQAQKPVDAPAAAKAAIAKAKSTPPLSLSAFPAGASAAVDEINAVAQMSNGQLMNSFFGNSPEANKARIDRLLTQI